MTNAESILPEKMAAYRKETLASRARGNEFAMDVLVDVMVQADIDPAAIYAFKRTRGLFPTDNFPFTPEELAEWDRAVDDYYEKFYRTPTQ